MQSFQYVKEPERYMYIYFWQQIYRMSVKLKIYFERSFPVLVLITFHDTKLRTELVLGLQFSNRQTLVYCQCTRRSHQTQTNGPI